MHILYLLGKIYPFVAFPLAFVIGHLSLFFFRKRNRIHVLFSLVVLSLVISGLLWIVFRGDLHSDRWIQTLFVS